MRLHERLFKFKKGVELYDVLVRCLQVTPEGRITPEDLLLHPLFTGKTLSSVSDYNFKLSKNENNSFEITEDDKLNSETSHEEFESQLSNKYPVLLDDEGLSYNFLFMCQDHRIGPNPNRLVPVTPCQNFVSNGIRNTSSNQCLNNYKPYQPYWQRQHQIHHITREIPCQSFNYMNVNGCNNGNLNGHQLQPYMVQQNQYHLF